MYDVVQVKYFKHAFVNHLTYLKLNTVYGKYKYIQSTGKKVTNDRRHVGFCVKLEVYIYV